MLLTNVRRGAALALALALASACTSTGTPAATAAPTEAATAAPTAAVGWPFEGVLKDGSTFTLNPDTAAKVRAGEPINYVFSYASAAIPLYSDQMLAGFESGQATAQAIYPLNGKAVAPTTASGEVSEQVAQVEALFNANQIECFSVQPQTEQGFTPLINKMIAKGIPVFTVGSPTGGLELSNFTQIPTKEGAQAAQVVLDWAEKEVKDLQVFAVTSGAPTAEWAQGRMKSFMEAIRAAIPDATFVTTQENALDATFEPAKAYDAYKAFLTGHPDVQIILNSDITTEHAARAIKDLGMAGKVFTIGWNVSYGQLDAIDEGIQIAALDQKWSEQGAFGSSACAEFFRNGKVLPNSQTLLEVTKENSAAAREDLEKILGE